MRRRGHPRWYRYGGRHMGPEGPGRMMTEHERHHEDVEALKEYVAELRAELERMEERLEELATPAT